MQANYRKLFEKAPEYLAISLWKPNFLFTKAKGSKIWLNDKPYLDFACGPGVANVGHNHPEILGAVIDIFRRCESGWGGNMLLNKYQIMLAEKLCRLTPGKFPKRVFFSNSGGEAVEAAILACLKKRPDRRGMVSFIGDFHGRLGFSREATTSRQMHFEKMPWGIEKKFFLTFPADNPETPSKKAFADVLSTPEKYMSYVENTIGPFINEIGFANFELVEGEGGINMARKEMIQALIRYLRKNEVWVIVDEVQTGLGRTGRMWASDIYEVEPDIMTIAKALSGGVVPIGATVMREDLSYINPGEHCNTFGAGPAACGAGLAVLDIIQKEGLVKRSETKGTLLRERLASVKDEHKQTRELVSDVSGCGLMNRITFRDAGGMPASEVRNTVLAEAMNSGLFLMSAGERSIRLMPPLTISDGEMTKAIKTLVTTISRVHARL